MFRRESFLPGPEGWDTFHRRAIDEGRRYEAKLAEDLSGLVFDEVFPRLAQAMAREAPAETPLSEIRYAALVLLYRLVFVLYAEDRGLLPVADRRYRAYALRGLRDEIGELKSGGAVFSALATGYWGIIDDLCRAIDRGDASVGLPPYNGGLFDARRTPLLESIRLRNKDVADIIDRLCFLSGPAPATTSISATSPSSNSAPSTNGCLNTSLRAKRTAALRSGPACSRANCRAAITRRTIWSA